MPAREDRQLGDRLWHRLRHLPWRRPHPAGWWVEAGLAVALAVLTAALYRGRLLRLDVVVRDWCDAHRSPGGYWVARVGNYLGQGTPLTLVCLVIAVLLVWRRRALWPVLLVVAAFVLTFGSLEPLKLLTDRAAPHAGVPDPQRFGSGGASYPSGHLANAVVWYGVFALLLSGWLAPRWRRLVRVLPPAVLTVTTVYLGFHWLTDTLAGLVLGLLLDRLLHRMDWPKLPGLPPPRRR